MALLHDIQASLLDDKVPLGPILLKIKFLAAKLGNHTLADWVKYETEGYPPEVTVPDYRIAGITYEGNFTNGAWVVNGTQVPGALVKKYANEHWLNYSLREPLAVIESYVAKNAEGKGSGRYSIGTGNLKALIGDKVYKGYTCTHLEGYFSAGAFVQVGAVVRAKLVDLVLELEALVPEAATIEVGATVPSSVNQATVTQITNTTIYGNVSNVTNTGAGAQIAVKVLHGDTESLKQGLIAAGLSPEEADELSTIAEAEKPTGKKQPFGKRAKAWIGKRLEAGVDGVMKIGGKAAEDEISGLFQRFYDMF
jgi:hypothetical protein